jgi:glycosyltransferase involved in cell wall biosynthesis
LRPRVSVLLPAFDAETTLHASLRSVQRQTETHWQCVIVDDGSRDGTGRVARAFADADNRFEVFATPHRGVVEALSAGLERCRGRVIARMDADDLMHRQRLKDQLQLFESRPELAALGSHVRLFRRRGVRDGLRAYERWLNGIDSPQRVREEAFVECPIAHPTLMIRAEILRSHGYRDRGWPEDYDLILRLLTAGHEGGGVPRRLLLWRDAPGRLWRTGRAYAQARFTACKARYLASSLLGAGDEYILWGYGETGKALRSALHAEGKRPSHIVELHPRRLGKTIHGAPVIAPPDLARLPRRPMIVSVAGERAREEIRTELRGMGYRETADFVCAA